MLEVDGNEKETVDGSDNPGKDESRTFTFDAILKSAPYWSFTKACGEAAIVQKEIKDKLGRGWRQQSGDMTDR